jgi:hypothetical protein
MRLRIVLLVALVLVLLVAGAQPALAWRHGVFVGVGPLWYPWYGYPYPYPYPYVYPAPPVVIERPEPQVYVQSQPAPPPAQNYWYYCEDAKGYYPYVQQCPRGWMQVVPQAPSR